MSPRKIHVPRVAHTVETETFHPLRAEAETLNSLCVEAETLHPLCVEAETLNSLCVETEKLHPLRAEAETLNSLCVGAETLHAHVHARWPAHSSRTKAPRHLLL